VLSRQQLHWFYIYIVGGPRDLCLEACGAYAMAWSSQQLQEHDPSGPGRPRTGSAVLCGPIRLSALCDLCFPCISKRLVRPPPFFLSHGVDLSFFLL
jgi:hypothetical protein